MTIPADTSWGKLTGARVHDSITTVKEFDQTPFCIAPYVKAAP